MNKKLQTLKAKPKQNRKVAPKKPVKEGDEPSLANWKPPIKVTNVKK